MRPSSYDVRQARVHTIRVTAIHLGLSGESLEGLCRAVAEDRYTRDRDRNMFLTHCVRELGHLV